MMHDAHQEVSPLEMLETLEMAPERNDSWWSSSITLDALDATEFPPLRYVVDQLVVEGGLTLLAGAPKSGKSLLAMGCALAVASDGHALGRYPVTAGDVLYLSLDDQSRARAQRRIRNILNGDPVPPAMTLHTDHNIGADKKAAQALNSYLHAHPGCRLIVIDTVEHLRADRAAGVGVYTADVRFLANLRWVLQQHPHAAILALAHTRKGEDEDPISAVSGTHGVTGGADCVLTLTGKRGLARRLLDVVSRDDDDKRVALLLGHNGLTVSDDDPDDPALLLSTDDAALYRTVAGLPDGVTAKDLALKHPSITNIGDRLSRLCKQGTLRRQARGVYVKP